MDGCGSFSHLISFFCNMAALNLITEAYSLMKKKGKQPNRNSCCRGGRFWFKSEEKYKLIASVFTSIIFMIEFVALHIRAHPCEVVESTEQFSVAGFINFHLMILAIKPI